MSALLFSVVVPLYNKETTILECLQSVLGQTFRGFELVVVDDGSTDNSVEVVKKLHDGRIRLIQQTNKGRSVARNRGIAESRGELVALLDADDLWESGFLQAISELRGRYPEAGLYSTGVGRCWMNGRDDLLVSIAPEPGTTSALVDDYLVKLPLGDFVTSSNVVLPKRILDEVGGFAEDQKLGEDRELWARVALRYPLGCDSRILAWYFTPSETVARYRDVLQDYVPPAIQMLRSEKERGAIPEAMLPQVDRYLNWGVVRHCEGLLWDGELEELRRFRQRTAFVSLSARIYAGILDWGSRYFPKRLVTALLMRPARWVRQFRLKLLPGTAINQRSARCSHRAPAGLAKMGHQV